MIHDKENYGNKMLTMPSRFWTLAELAYLYDVVQGYVEIAPAAGRRKHSDLK